MKKYFKPEICIQSFNSKDNILTTNTSALKLRMVNSGIANIEIGRLNS